MKHRIYVASSWRNRLQSDVVIRLREMGHKVYDFRNPGPGKHGFSWGQISEDYIKWTPKEYIENLKTNDVIAKAYKLDMDALNWCNMCILLLPCGRSAHLEAGYAIGKGKMTAVYIDEEKFEPDLMYLMADKISDNLDDIYSWIDSL